MDYASVMQAIEIIVELFAIYFCASRLVHDHRDKPWVAVILIGVVFCFFYFHPIVSLILHEWHPPTHPVRTAMNAAAVALMIDILYQEYKKKKKSQDSIEEEKTENGSRIKKKEG